MSGPILIVDDEPSNLAAMRQILAGAYRLVFASNGGEALAAVAKHKPLLILLDIRMPGLDGYAVCRQLKNDPATASIPVIFVTGLGDVGNEAAGFAAGAVDYLTKPVSPPVVLARVALQIRLREMTEHLEEMVRERTVELGTEVAERRIAQEHLQQQAVVLEKEITERKIAQEALQKQTEELIVTAEKLHEKIAEYEISQEQRRNAENELKESVQFLNEAQHLAQIGSWSLLVASDEMRWSRQMYHIFGCDPQKLPLNFSQHEQFFSKESWERLNRAMQRAGSDGLPYELDLELVRPDGQTRQVRVKGSSIRDETGKIVRLYGTKQDITEQKQLERVQVFLAEACSGAAEDEPFFDKLARYLAQNLRMDCVRIDRLEADTLSARTIAVWCDGSFAESRTYTLKDTPCGALDGNQVCYFPAEVCRLFPGDQALLDLQAESFLAVTLWSRANQPIGLIAVVGRKPLKDKALVESILKLVTMRAASELERLEAEEEQATLEAQLQQAQKMEAVGRLAGGVAHDFNNMLTVILGHAQLALMDSEPDTQLNEHLTLIQKSANKSADLTRQLLAFARKQTIAPKVLELNESVSGMLKMLQRLIGEDIRLTWRPGVELWPIMADPSQVDQILANLCVNARDAIAGVGMVSIETGNSSFDDSHLADRPDALVGEYVWISVSDDGCGISRETLPHIFEPFFTTKAPGEGTGLGLSTVFGIVKQNNGFLDVQSEPGRGSVFKVYLPRYSGPSAARVGEGAEVPIPRGDETILVVEDESAILNMTKMILEKQGYTVIAANNPREALRLSSTYSGEIHLLMTDVIMPEMNGRDLAQALLSQRQNMKCLFISGYTADVIAHHGVLDEGVHFIQKPFALSDLAIKVRSVLRM
jgi:two-component system, cell cycle sensor histidine kinase and response regulator CckA